jgi:hypothetical protein
MDFFLDENEVLTRPGHDENIHLQDFQEIFKDAIIRARDQARDEAVRNVNASLFKDDVIYGNAANNSMRQYNRSEVEELMKDLVMRGRAYTVYDISDTKCDRSGFIRKD